MGADLFHADSRLDRRTDKRTDMTKLRIALRNFSKAPKKTCHNVKQINTIYNKMQNYLVLNYRVN